MTEDVIGLGRRIGHVSHLYRRSIDNVIGDASKNYTDSLTGRNFWVLRYLQEHDGEKVYQKDLEAEFKIRRSTISKMVDLMEQKGLLVRESVGADARLKSLSLTELAREVLQTVFQGVQEMENEVRESFTAEEYQTLNDLLEKLGKTLESREASQQERN